MGGCGAAQADHCKQSIMVGYHRKNRSVTYTYFWQWSCDIWYLITYDRLQSHIICKLSFMPWPHQLRACHFHFMFCVFFDTPSRQRQQTWFSLWWQVLEENFGGLAKSTFCGDAMVPVDALLSGARTISPGLMQTQPQPVALYKRGENTGQILGHDVPICFYCYWVSRLCFGIFFNILGCLRAKS